MPLQIEVIQGSILDVDVQVIVNAANSYGIMGVAWQRPSGGRQETENVARNHSQRMAGMWSIWFLWSIWSVWFPGQDSNLRTLVFYIVKLI